MGDALDRMVRDGKLSPAGSESIKQLMPYMDDPNVLRQLENCRNHGSASPGLFDWLVTPARAAAACGIDTTGGRIWVDPAYEKDCLNAARQLGRYLAGAVGAAARSGALAAIAVVLTPTPTGGKIDQRQSFADGSQLHITGYGDEVSRKVTLTNADGSVFTINIMATGESGQFEVTDISTGGASLPPSAASKLVGSINKAAGGRMLVLNQNRHTSDNAGQGSNASGSAGIGHNGGPPIEPEGPNNPKQMPLPPGIDQIVKDAEKISTTKPGQVTKPRNTTESILWNSVIKNPTGAGRRLDGMNNDPRFPTSAGFQKMEAKTKLSNGEKITIHYQYNDLKKII